MARSKVAVLKCKPETILTDIERLRELAGTKQALAAGCTTILKDNISWHYPFPSANTTPWQLEGTILARILGSEAYHDYYRWPLKDRRTFEAWKRDTSRGRLFETYAQAGSPRPARRHGHAAEPSGATVER